MYSRIGRESGLHHRFNGVTINVHGHRCEWKWIIDKFEKRNHINKTNKEKVDRKALKHSKKDEEARIKRVKDEKVVLSTSSTYEGRPRQSVIPMLIPIHKDIINLSTAINNEVTI